MDPFIAVVGVGILVVGTLIALGWWHLARKAAPYRDETGERSASASPREAGDVIVIPPVDKTPRDVN